MDEATIRRDCAEAHALITASLSGAVPPDTQVDRLWGAMSGHLLLLTDAVSDDCVGSAAGPMRDAVVKMLQLGRDVLALPRQVGLAGLAIFPAVIRLLLLVHQEQEAFLDAPGTPEFLDGWDTADAL